MKIPQGWKKLNHTILAEGEATGHAHVVMGEGVELYEKPDKTLILSSLTGAKIVHEEHGKITIPAGLWKINKVMEFNHSQEEAREVKD
jgi:hypothetical protein